MLKRVQFQRVRSFLNRNYSIRETSYQTDVAPELVCAISKGWQPRWRMGRPGSRAERQVPTFSCDRACAECEHLHAHFPDASRPETHVVNIADNDYFGVFLSPDCARRYHEIHQRKVREREAELARDDWMARCFPD